MRKKIFIILIFLFVNTGCSGLKTYPNDLPKNLTVKTNTDSRMFKRVYPSLHIYDIDGSCSLTYIGTVKLNKETTEVGLPAGKLNYFSFQFDTSGWGTQGSTAMGVLLNTKKKRKYKIDASYKDFIYNIEVFEKRKKKFKEIEHKTHADCQG